MIGCFGELVFEVNSDYVLTFDNFKHEFKSRYARHELINQTPVLEWLGDDTQKITLNITLTTALGVNPAEAINIIHRMCLNGVADWLVIATWVIGGTMWVITEANYKAISTDAIGNPIVATMDVTFESYVSEVEEY